jgi:hypothetical protein
MRLIVCVIKKPQYRGGQDSSTGCSAIGKKLLLCGLIDKALLLV